ncbi:MAG: hypothetical protein M0Q42_11830 [Xanthomonadales bacterium]|nr:hypothetical protein [Xanthomonadales bacterium]
MVENSGRSMARVGGWLGIIADDSRRARRLDASMQWRFMAAAERCRASPKAGGDETSGETSPLAIIGA